MLFSSLLHIFQSEHYDRKRFLSFVYSHFDWWNFSIRGKTEWTLRAKLLMGGAFIVWGILGIFLFAIIQNNAFACFVLLFAFFLFPFFLVLADLFISPLVTFQKKKIFSQAKNLVKNASVQVVAITGSFGKTTMKTILESVLSQKFSVFTIPGNINTDLGVANFLIQNSEKLKKSEILLLEMGAYTTGEIASVCDIVQPDYSFLTAIAPVHLERFGSIQAIIKAKLELPQATRKKAYFLKNIHPHISVLPSLSTAHAFFIDPKEAEKNIQFLPAFEGFSFIWKENMFNTKLIAAHTIDQMVGALALAEELGLSLPEMQKGIADIPYPEHRLAVIKNPVTGVTVIDDSYNGNFAGFVSGLKVLSRAEARKVVLTPGIVELGEMQTQVHADLAKIYSETVDVLLLIENSNTKIILDSPVLKEWKGMIKIYKTAMEAHADLPNILKKGDTILFQNDLPDNYR